MNAFVGKDFYHYVQGTNDSSQNPWDRKREDFQMILSDTPGIIKPAYEMQASMMNFVKSAFEDADILIYMVEIEQDLKTKPLQ
jgi:GTPase Era involved in 16S rRNA processing